MSIVVKPWPLVTLSKYYVPEPRRVPVLSELPKAS